MSDIDLWEYLKVIPGIRELHESNRLPVAVMKADLIYAQDAFKQAMEELEEAELELYKLREGGH